MEQNLSLIQTEFVEEEILELIDVIHCFPSSADFANWITDGKFKHKIAHQHLEGFNYARSYLYELEGVNFFHGKIEINTEKLETKTIQTITQGSTPFFSTFSAYQDMKKITISRTVAIPYYTILSKVVFKQQPFGMCWEIYNVSCLDKIYQKKNDPLRYWRKIRAE